MYTVSSDVAVSKKSTNASSMPVLGLAISEVEVDFSGWLKNTLIYLVASAAFIVDTDNKSSAVTVPIDIFIFLYIMVLLSNLLFKLFRYFSR